MGEVERYRKLGLEEALHRPQDYPSACKELSSLLRTAYSKLPKALRSIVFQDTLTAFRLLPLHGSSRTFSAHLLFQASEAALPKQRKVLAVSEFKHAVVAQKRLLKETQSEEVCMQMPEDVLIHIFSFLDFLSLANSSVVCKSWKSASRNETLWKSQYFLFFGENEDKHCKMLGVGKKSIMAGQNKDNATLEANFSWREAFSRKITGKAWGIASGRAYCDNCHAIIWPSELTCTSRHHCGNNAHGLLNIKAISPSQVVNFILGETLSSNSDSDSDEDYFYERRLPKLWALSHAD